MITPYRPATKPTLYFIGVTTSKSSIMKVFPAWAQFLGLEDAEIKGIDFPLHAYPDAYRQAVAFIRDDPLSLGALVTTHKIDLFHACKDMFDDIDPHAQLMEETSCISKRNGKLVCHAKDPISSGLAMDAFLPEGYFSTSKAELFSIGAGGSTIALTWHMMHRRPVDDRPSRIIVSNRSLHRIQDIKRIHDAMGRTVPVDYALAPNPEDNNAIVGALRPGSVVINATGLGKDAPGSPLTDAVAFPQNGVVWDLNYRGELIFLDQARAQQSPKTLQIEDGWVYFIHGWTQVIAEVFHIDIPTHGPRFDEISDIAKSVSKG